MANFNHEVPGYSETLNEIQIKHNPDEIVVDSHRVRGGGIECESIAHRDTIPLEWRKEGITIAYCKDIDKKFELKGGIENEFWVEYKTGGGDVIVGNRVVSLSAGKTFGKWVNGDTIPSDGKTAAQLFELAIVEALQPTVALTSPTSIQYNQTAINNVLNFSYVINSLNATADSVKLEWRRNNAGAWSTLTTNKALTTYTHSLTDTAFNTQPFNYQYTVTDSAGGTRTVALTLAPQAYVAPTLAISPTASALNGTQTNAIREKGNKSTVLNGSATSNRAFVALVSYQWQYQMDAGAWTNIGLAVAISGQSANFTPLTHNDAALLNASTVAYRVQVLDSSGVTTTSATSSIVFQFLYKLGYYPTNGVLTGLEAYALGNSILATSKARTVTGVTAGVGNYTFIMYPTAFNDLVNIIQNGATPVLGAFTKITDTLAVTNQYGVTTNYTLYKSNASNAFTNSTLVIS